MAKRNGTIWKLAIGLASLLVTALIAMQAFGVFQGEIKANDAHQDEAIQDIEDDVLMNWIVTDLNSEHRHRFEEKVSNIERDVTLILEEVRK